MPDTQPQTPATAQPIKAILQRISVPLCLFSSALFVLLLLSYFILLPRFTQFSRSDGVSMSPRQLASYRQSLSADITKREEERVKLVLPITDETYNRLRAIKHATMSLSDLREQLLQAMSRVGESGDVLSITMISIDGQTVTMAGDVHGVGTRSMTVLAAYVEQVSALPFVSDLMRPAFTREGTLQTGFHSPFTLSFTLSSTER